MTQTQKLELTEATKKLNKEIAAARKAYSEASMKARAARDARIAQAYNTFAQDTGTVS